MNLKDDFYNYCRKSEDQTKSLWTECLFVPDANVLLDLYRYSQQPREETLAIFDEIKDRLWMPYQVALEFMRNRQSVLVGQYTHYEQCEVFVSTLKDTLADFFSKHQSLERHGQTPISQLQSGIDEAILTFSKAVSEGKKSQPETPTDDSVLDRLCDLFQGRIGECPELSELDELFKLGEERYAQKRPPGFLDSSGDKKKADNTKYGDWIIWHQTLTHAKAAKLPIVMITSETGDDWWWIVKGRRLGPHPQMVKEMMEIAGVEFHIYHTPQFLDIARTLLKVNVEDESIKEAKDVRKDAAAREAVEDTASEILGVIESARAYLVNVIANADTLSPKDQAHNTRMIAFSMENLVKSYSLSDADRVLIYKIRSKLKYQLREIKNGMWNTIRADEIYSLLRKLRNRIAHPA